MAKARQQTEEALKKLPPQQVLDRIEKARQMMEAAFKKLPLPDMLDIINMDRENYELACETWREDSERLKISLEQLERYIQNGEMQQARNLAVCLQDRLKSLVFNLENLISVYVQ